MACCGQNRRQHSAMSVGQGGRARPAAVVSQPRQRRSDYAYFQYFGRTGLTAVGPISGLRYRFDKPGAVVAVDPRDRRSLAAVPHLRQVGRR